MPEPVPGPAYRIVTPRLILRCWNPEDVFLLNDAVLASLDHLREWMPWAHKEPDTIENRLQRIRNWRANFDLGSDFVYGIFDPEENRVLGGSGLHTRPGPEAREIGYWIRVDSINRGLATEAAAALTRVAFEVDRVERVEIHCDAGNTRSAAIPRKLGYRLDATLRRRSPAVPGRPLGDRMIWTLYADEYPQSTATQVDIQVFDAAGRPINL